MTNDPPSRCACFGVKADHSSFHSPTPDLPIEWYAASRYHAPHFGDDSMRANELFQGISADVADSVLRYFREEERDVYRSAVSTLAQQRKLRPIFVQRKPVDDQIAWLVKTLKLRSSEEVAEQILQVWLLKARSEMLIKFLDDVGIEHDEDGSVEDLPETIDAAKLKTAVDNLLGAYPASEVVVYLWMFQMQTAEGWPEIAELLKNDERLKLA